MLVTVGAGQSLWVSYSNSALRESTSHHTHRVCGQDRSQNQAS